MDSGHMPRRSNITPRTGVRAGGTYMPTHDLGYHTFGRIGPLTSAFSIVLPDNDPCRPG